MRVAELALDMTSMGLVCSVGHDVVTACAAIRAGISRPAPIFEHPVLDLISHESVPLIGHPVTPLTDGFCSSARWLRLASYAFDDLLRAGELGVDARDWSKTLIVVLLPDLGELRFAPDRYADLARIHAAFVDMIGSRSPQQAAGVEVRAAGHAGFAELLLDTPALLREWQVERLVVLATDSYIEPYTLTWLASLGRLKTDTNPVGLMPGEAAAAMVLEPGGSKAGRRPQITGAGVARFESTVAEDPYQPGRVLADITRPLLRGPPNLLVDLNGEVRRAEGHGYFIERLEAEALEVRASHALAGELGELGSVHDAVALVYAARCLERRIGEGATTIASLGNQSARCVTLTA